MPKKTGCYIYAYLRSSASEYGETGTTYYIGKGKHRRGFYARAFDKRHNIHIPKDKSDVVILADSLSDNDARQAEMLLIFLHGRIDRGTGCLRNLTDGGEGCEGRIVTQKFRDRMSEVHKGKTGAPWTEERRIAASIRMSGENNPFYGQTHSEESLEKMSKSHKGWKPSPEIIAKTTAARMSSPIWEESVRKSALSRVGHIVSEETRRKISESQKGKVISEEAKEKMRAAKLGRTQSKEHRASVSKAVAESWVKRREKYGSSGQSGRSILSQGV